MMLPGWVYDGAVAHVDATCCNLFAADKSKISMRPADGPHAREKSQYRALLQKSDWYSPLDTLWVLAIMLSIDTSIETTAVRLRGS